MPDTRFSILRTKLNRPRLMDGLVVRPRLLNRLNQSVEKPLALISAPAGFGKTTLLCQWLETCPLPNAWVQLDESDSELPVFLTYIVAALRRIFPESCPETLDLLLSRQMIPQNTWKMALANDLYALRETPFVLTLDDYHLLHNPDIDLLLADLLRSEPSSLHLLIAARRGPALAFSRLDMQGDIVEIRAADLRFTNAEVEDYFERTVGAPLSQTALLQLQEKMEGWPAGLSLAAINLREAQAAENFIAHIDTSERRLSDYLMDQALNNQPVEVQNFLVRTSVLDRFCAPLCQAVVGMAASQGEVQSRIEQIERAQLFLMPLDNQGYWYRYHHLFQKMLYARLQIAMRPGDIVELHQRAAQWLAGEGFIEEAVAHLIAAQDWVSAARLVERDLRQQLNQEDRLGIVRRLKLFPAEFIQTRPGLLLLQAWDAHFNLRLPLIWQLTEQIQTILDQAPADRLKESLDSGVIEGYEEIDLTVMQAQVNALKGMVCSLTNRGSEGAEFSHEALAATPQDWAFVRGAEMVYLGLCLQSMGQGREAIQLLTVAYETIAERRAQYGIRLLFSMATCYFLMGEIDKCRQTAEVLLQEAQAAKLQLLQGWGHYLLGRVALEKNDLEQACGHFESVAEHRYVVNRICAQDGMAGWINTLQALGQPEQARQAVELYSQFEHEQAGPLGDAFQSLVAWLALLNGDQDAAWRWAQGYESPFANRSMIWMQVSHFYKAHILVALPGLGTESDIRLLLDDLLLLAENTCNLPLTIRLLSLQSIWLDNNEHRSEAQDVLLRAVAIARPGHFVRTFVEFGEPMYTLLQRLSRQEKETVGLTQYIASILKAFQNDRTIQASRALPRQAGGVLLTERELDVLKLLAKRLSIKEISVRLFISPSTVRQHTIRIYRKLGVSGKRQAAEAAWELGLVDDKAAY